MRIWSIHPRYLDTKGLVACWRETLLARHVLLGLTKGYTNHPQLERFKQAPSPVAAIDAYLMEVHKEAVRRSYKFDATKFTCTAIVPRSEWSPEVTGRSIKAARGRKGAKRERSDEGGEESVPRDPSSPTTPTMAVTRGQVAYEVKHLLAKLKERDPTRYKEVATKVGARTRGTRAAKSRGELEPLLELHPLFEAVDGDVESWERV